MTTNRIKEIQDLTAHPQSQSVQQALVQVWTECKQESNIKYKELLDSHNELLELLRNARPLMQPREYCKGDDYLILDGRIENAINKAKNIKL